MCQTICRAPKLFQTCRSSCGWTVTTVHLCVVQSKQTAWVIKIQETSEGRVCCWWMQWDYIYEVKRWSIIHILVHDSTTQTDRSTEVLKPKCSRQYNLAKGGVDLKDQMVQPYLLERKQAKKCYMKSFSRLLDIAFHNAFMVCNSWNKTLFDQ